VTGLELAAVTRATSWSRFGTVVDVGGGNGSFLAGLLGRFRQMRGTVFDRPEVIGQAGPVFAAAGVADRGAAVGGSFLTGPVPPGADAYVLKRILYSWDDDAARTILDVVRRAMRPDSRLFIMEASRNEPVPGAVDSTVDADDAAAGLQSRMDLLMLTLSGGGARSVAEHEKLLAAAGLTLVACTRTPMYPVLEAAPAAG
jgi:O-methyltransferase domain